MTTPKLSADTFDEFEIALRDFGSTLYDGLADDDDPLGHCLIVGPDGMNMMAIDGGMLAPENLRDLFMGVCAEIVKAKATWIGWLLSAYEVDVEPGGPPPPSNFADDPRRVEVFQSIAVQAEGYIAHKALILRSPSRLDDWKPETYERSPQVGIPQRALIAVRDGLAPTL